MTDSAIKHGAMSPGPGHASLYEEQVLLLLLLFVAVVVVVVEVVVVVVVVVVVAVAVAVVVVVVVCYTPYHSITLCLCFSSAGRYSKQSINNKPLRHKTRLNN